MCKELIDFDGLQKLYGEQLLNFDIFDQANSHGKKCWIELKNRVIEHVRCILNSTICTDPSDF